MNKFAFFTMVAICFALPTFSGCSGGGENTVIEAPAEVTEEEPAMEGMTDEEYDKMMDAEME